MRTGSKFSWVLAAAMTTLAAGPAAAQEQVMSDHPSECEVFSALSGDSSCQTEPSAGGQSVEGETQGLAVSTESGQGSGMPTSTSSKSSTKTAATGNAQTATSSGPKAATFDSIQFEYNSAELTAPARGTLDTVAHVLQEPYFANKTFVIEGHTDAKGSAEYNLALSERRAQAVVRYLVQMGVAANQLSARGMGESEPLDKSNPDASVNRRVVVLNLGG